MEVNSDLHIHSRYSAATSGSMDLPTLGREAQKKGIRLLGTGDCLHPKWLGEIKSLEEDDGIYTLGETKFVLTVEIEDIRRVHHLLILPSISKAMELHDIFSKYSCDIDSNGRPRVDLDGVVIAEYARDVSALIGPSHAFTPWTSIYAYHDSLEDCYGDMTGYLSFVELGLSADSDYADRIKELRKMTFLTNSDAHSPWPIRLAREFNRLKLEDFSFDEVKRAIYKENGRRPTLNVGMPPEEGKYNETACIRCYRHYSLKDAFDINFKCSCGGRIVKGVRDRIDELAEGEGAVHPELRPPYLHLIPLSEIIAMALSLSPRARAVEKNWSTLLKEFGNEVTVLVDAGLEDMNIDQRIVDSIRAFREGKIIVRPGGGGRYGVIELPEDSGSQRSLFDF
ncbi:MAG: TIGR00375 family protein [Halobacteriota archaeon]|nr:TIGR00375 family protein [Halobacteriota archaeon]